MKVLQIVSKPQMRGAETFAFQLSGALRRMGHEVETCYLYPHEGEGALPLLDRDVLLGGDERHPFEKLPGFNPGLLRKLVSVIEGFGPDVVQVNGSRTVKYGALAKRKTSGKKRWALIYRNIGDPAVWIRGFMRKLFYRNIVIPALDGIVGVSTDALGAYRGSFGFTGPAELIPTAFDPDHMSPRRGRDELRKETGVTETDTVILYAGSISPEKRLDRMLRVFMAALDRMPDLKLWIVGGGPLRRGLEEESTGLAGVTFFGPSPDVASFMNAADILMLTSDTEGVPAVVLEAGYMGLPVLASRVGGLSECITDGETGVLVDPDDEEGFVRALLGLAGEDPHRRSVMGERARKRMLEHYSIDKIAKSYVAFYQKVSGLKNA